MVNEDEMLKNEHVEKILTPHPLSFVKLQSLCIFLIVWGTLVGWLVNFSSYKDMFSGNPWYPILLWGLVMLVASVVVSLATVQWSIFFLYLGIFAAGVSLVVSQGWLNQSDVLVFVPAYSVTVSIIGFLIVELYRRSYSYILTNYRIIFKGGVLTKRERTIRYDKVSDISTKQGIFGQIFGFGTITPKLSSEKASIENEIKAAEKKSRLNIFSKKDDQNLQSKAYCELHGVYPYKDVRKMIENMVQDHVITPYQKEQVEFHKQQLDVQKQMRDLLKNQTQTKKTLKKKPVAVVEQNDEEEKEEEKEEETEGKEEVFQPEQIDIQKQMKDLLKKQIQIKDEEEPEEEKDEEEEEEEK